MESELGGPLMDMHYRMDAILPEWAVWVMSGLVGYAIYHAVKVGL